MIEVAHAALKLRKGEARGAEAQVRTPEPSRAAVGAAPEEGVKAKRGTLEQAERLRGSRV